LDPAPTPAAEVAATRSMKLSANARPGALTTTVAVWLSRISAPLNTTTL
jgi:hypothetical protein